MIAKHKKNVVGPQVRKIRYRLGLFQKDLAGKLQRLGWDLDRGGVSKIEAQLVWIGDFQLFYLAAALGVDPVELFPSFDPGLNLNDNIVTLTKKK